MWETDTVLDLVSLTLGIREGLKEVCSEYIHETSVEGLLSLLGKPVCYGDGDGLTQDHWGMY